jgi:lipopolysaccharide export system protein LptA
MKHRRATLLFLVLAAAGTPALAERADRNKPMNIEADALRYDDANQTSTFTGRVVVTKGTILMRGARLDVRQDASGQQFGTLTAESGQRAFFRQKREAADEYIEGEGERIEYDSLADSVKLIQRGELRRYFGATLNDQITGSVIVYNNTTEVFTVNGAPTAPSAPAGAAGGGRVRAMLTPRGAASAPATAAAPARPAASQPAPGLRPSSTLGGERP